MANMIKQLKNNINKACEWLKKGIDKYWGSVDAEGRASYTMFKRAEVIKY